ncbi:hypothetical protein CSUI_007254, partial [Cystoisospora suis]
MQSLKSDHGALGPLASE